MGLVLHHGPRYEMVHLFLTLHHELIWLWQYHASYIFQENSGYFYYLIF